jgi:hypothetical protein
LLGFTLPRKQWNAEGNEYKPTAVNKREAVAASFIWYQGHQRKDMVGAG